MSVQQRRKGAQRDVGEGDGDLNKGRGDGGGPVGTIQPDVVIGQCGLVGDEGLALWGFTGSVPKYQ